MGKRDAIKLAPVDKYRKEIGKQDWKKSKKGIKGMKGKGCDEQTSAQTIILLLAVVVAVFSCIYMFLMWYFGVVSIHDYQQEMPF